MTDRVPEIEEAMLERVRGLAARDDVARAMSICMCGKFCAVRSMNKALAGEYIDIL